MRPRHWQDWVMLAAGAWLFASLFALGLMPPATPAALLYAICGMVLVVSSSQALVIPDPLEEWIDLVTGVALMTGGFLGDAIVATNAVIVGAVVTACAFSALRQQKHA